MVALSLNSDVNADYQSLYDGYWLADDRIGESSGNLEEAANQIVISCGIGRTLDIGSGEGLLVEALLRKCVDAHGLDVSEVVVSRCNKRIPGRFTHGSVLALPFDDESFQTVVSTDCLEHLAPEDVPAALKEIYRVSSRYVFLKVATTQDRDAHWHLTVEGRAWWESRCFEAGFRKHPAYYRINSYDSLNHDGWQIAILLEKIPADGLANYPLSSLKDERDLHMDMLRESGSRSDAHVGRYYFAAKFIRPGDVVLDAACGLGYGTHVVRSVTKAGSFISIDGSEYAIDYARHNFGADAVKFHQGFLPDCLETIPDNSVDHVLCFETLEHVQDPVRLLAEFQRVLTPGGRITCSVPHDWSDETGTDPNPFHLHVYNKARFIEELGLFFDVEHLFGQTADRVKQPGDACVWLERQRSLVEIAEDQCEVEAEWLLAVATKSPLEGRQVPYRERVFSSDEQRSAGHALAFARDYSNPWLIRSLVSIGLRTENSALRERWAMAVWEDSSAGVADRGAALCVLAYAALAKGRGSSADWLMERIECYLADTANGLNPTVLRWRISLMYVGGLLALSSERRDVAVHFFSCVVAAPVEQYSATLLTKPAEGAYLLGLLLAGEGREAEAHRTWWDAFKQISASLGKRLTQAYETRPPLFEIREMAAALSLCGRLVAASAQCADLARRPGVFYDETHADNVSQMQSLVTAESHLANLQRDFLAQQSGLDGLVRGKEWLEAQWKGLEAERARLQESLNALQAGKEWLESQWRAQTVELDARQQHIEVQQSQIGELEARLATSESQLNALGADNARLAADLGNAREKVARLKRSFIFRVVRKLGFLRYF